MGRPKLPGPDPDLPASPERGGRVTALESTRRHRGWTDVHIDGAVYCRLPDDHPARSDLRVGDVVAPGALRRLAMAASRQEAIQLALRYLSVRPRSCREVELHLQRRSCERAAIGAALERCSELGYLDDRAFAAAYARDRIRLKPRATRQILMEIGAKGVSRADAEAGVSQALEDEGVVETDLLKRATDAAMSRFASRGPEAARRRVWAYLERRGFDGASIRAAVERCGLDSRTRE